MFRKLLLGIVILLMAGSTLAENFVSFNGKFYITYPDDWQQIDYLTVDTYLKQAGARRRTLEYEGVFAPAASVPWFSQTYLIMTLDTVSGLTQQRIDSVLLGFEDAFEKPRVQRTAATLLTDLSYGQLAWDATTKTAAVLTEVANETSGNKNTVLVMHFYDRGIVNYFFYATDSTLAINLPKLNGILASFSTENVESAIPRESSKIADPDKMPKPADSERKIPIWAPTSGGIVLILIIALAARRKRKSRQS